MSKSKSTKEKKVKNPLLEDEVVEEETVEEVLEDEIEEETVEDIEEKPKKATEKVEKKVNIADESLSDIATTKKNLESQEQIHFMIPLAEGEKPGSVHECFINGYKFSVPKGEMTIVPKAVANLLSDSYRIGMNAGADFRVDLNDKKQEALS